MVLISNWIAATDTATTTVAGLESWIHSIRSTSTRSRRGVFFVHPYLRPRSTNSLDPGARQCCIALAQQHPKRFWVFSGSFCPLHVYFLQKWWNSLMVTKFLDPLSHRCRSRLAGARSSSMMCRQPYTSMCAYASLLFLAPLCHAFVSPPASNALHFRKDCGVIGNIQQHTHKGCRSSKPAVPRMMAGSSELGGILHAGVIVSDTKASKVNVQAGARLSFVKCSIFILHVGG